MQVSDPNNVKIYNLSAGKSLPEWLSERKRRTLLKKNVDIRRRIELIQDFDMPALSTNVKVSRDGQYIIATGTYKPRVKCFDVNNLSLKFERCYDAEAVAFEILSDDYSKLVFLQCDRYVEFHVAHGRYYRMRVPKFGRDMKYHYPTCDLYVAGASEDIYRLNLERGQFMTPFTSKSPAINKIATNPINQMIVCGTQDGKVEAWDPRIKSCIGILDVAFNCIKDCKQLEGFPAVTALKFNVGGLQLGVGTASGQICLYDIRSSKAFLIKDHMYGFPIVDIEFHTQQQFVYSLDKSVVKIWDRNDGKLYTSIESTKPMNGLCVVGGTGLMFIANEQPKIQTYYIPSLGPAPKWASFLDALTEELEETNTEVVYDDYKFVTTTELENLGLDHLIGTNLLRAYMHGYFVDIRLYKKAKSVANPFEFDAYRKKKVKEMIEKDRTHRVQVHKLPTVNKDLALKLMGEQLEANHKKKAKNKANLLADERFKGLFENADFEIDKSTEEYRLLNPVLTRLDKSKKKELQKKLLAGDFEQVELEGKNSSDEDSDELDAEPESSDDDQEWTKEVKKQHKLIQRERKLKEQQSENEGKQPKMFELRQGEEFKGVHQMKRKLNKASLGERVANETHHVKTIGSVGHREITFTTNVSKRDQFMAKKNKAHRDERKKIVRSTFGMRSRKPMFKR